MRFFRRMLISLCVVLSVSCATAKKDTQGVFVFVSDTVRMPLLPPGAAGDVVEEYQYFSGTFAGQAVRLPLYLHCDKNVLSVLMLNDFGIDIGRLVYDAHGLSCDSEYIPSSVKAEYIIADLQNVYYDAEVLRLAYVAVSLRFVTEFHEEAGMELRRIYDGSRCLEEIQKKDDSICVRSFARNYEYVLLRSSGETD